jgi:hypothetical protein
MKERKTKNKYIYKVGFISIIFSGSVAQREL